MIEEWIEYRKDDPATHPGFEGAYLVTILSKTGAVALQRAGLASSSSRFRRDGYCATDCMGAYF